ncbi:AtrD, ABC-transporter [Cadophora sp. MPI-SDFR-AT-0126]|nr:AtrD, ABC-transporter [Leotiomycetes sp. MPI-SDFR-AT-0126]
MTYNAPFGGIPQMQSIEMSALEISQREYAQDASSECTTRIGSSYGGGTIDDREEEERNIMHLARTLTRPSGADSQYKNPFFENGDPALDPHSDKFDARVWTQSVLGISSRDSENPTRTAGVSFRNLSASGYGFPTDYQKTFGNYILELGNIVSRMRGIGKRKIQILRDFDGLVKSGEMLVVLGRPGSGCSTLLKTISGETNGFDLDPKSKINYQGIPWENMHHEFRGECIYQAEVDVHFPQLTVGQTLDFAAQARAPSNRIPGVSRKLYAEHMRDVIMAVFRLTHTMNTKVGNDFVRGVSGGERKRVSIAEAALGGSPIQCWDNSTRGLDSATALEFVKTLRLSTELSGSTAIVAIYQASQSIYDLFDKVCVLYEGRQIYFGDKEAAKTFFIELGFECPDRQTTADFLTSLTSPTERRIRPGFENRTPRTSDEFAQVWQASEDRRILLQEITKFETEFPMKGSHLEGFAAARKAQQSKRQRAKSPYTLSVLMQVKLCMQRGWQRLRGDLAQVISGVVSNIIMAIIVASVFFKLENNTNTLSSRGALLFFGVLLNAFASAQEIPTLFGQRPIVEKHTKYAFYHPFAEAIATMICDLPKKIATAIFFNIALYWMSGLRPTASNFFIFVLISFTCTMCMSMFFRSIGSTSRSLSQAQVPASIFILALVIYTGFTIPTRDMVPWFRWLNYLNPVAYAFEALMINEFHDRKIPCSVFVPTGPSYLDVLPSQKICSSKGAQAGADFVDGDEYLRASYGYEYSHLWRNLGIMIAFMLFGMAIHLGTTEFISAQRSKGEVLLFPRKQVPDIKLGGDEETMPNDRLDADTITAKKVTMPSMRGSDTQAVYSMGSKSRAQSPSLLESQKAIFHWESVNYEVPIKKETRKLLDNVDGWVKPGTLTALMGVSGAGKTTLLDVLASRVTMGVVGGSMQVDGRERNSGFQRKTGYVQQQDLHLATSTVREALTFSAFLRQPATTPKAEKLAYVDEVIGILEMEQYANAVVGVPGEGLNVEQRKRLTIGVELAAKPALLLFLDEPTSGLDSQTAWSICALLRKLANNGQAILCTIHQPSAILFQEFDRLLFLARGGKTVYFGDIGERSETLTKYFERQGARPCGADENPAEWMIEIITAKPEEGTIDWPQAWRDSPERQAVKATLAEMRRTLSSKPADTDVTSLLQYAAPFKTQLHLVLIRVFQQYWRTPVYLFSKIALCTLSVLFIGFSFYNSATSLQGTQNQLFSLFMLLTIFSSLVSQIMPHFVTQRALYEVRERPSKTYSWQAFMLSNILVELPWNALVAVIIYVCFYYPIGMYRNAEFADQFTERSGLMFLFVLAFLLFASTFTNMVIAGIETAEGGSGIASLMFSLCLIFCGVLVGPNAMPRFWIFMYRVSPFTYLVSGMLSTGLANAKVICSDIEYLYVEPAEGSNCGEYFASFIETAGGYLTNANATTRCEFCTVADTNTLLRSLSIEYDTRWRNFSLLWVYIVFNVAMALALYYWLRVPKSSKKEKKD